MNSPCSLLVYFLNVNEVKPNYRLSSSRITLSINTVRANMGHGGGGSSSNSSKFPESVNQVLGSLGNSMSRCWHGDFLVWGREQWEEAIWGHEVRKAKTLNLEVVWGETTEVGSDRLSQLHTGLPSEQALLLLLTSPASHPLSLCSSHFLSYLFITSNGNNLRGTEAKRKELRDLW